MPNTTGRAGQAQIEQQVSVDFLLVDSDEPTSAIGTLNSLKAQDRGGWHLIAASTSKQTSAEPAQLTFVPCAHHPDRGAVLNALMARATGDWVAVISRGDTLAPTALVWIEQALREFPDTAILYSDEDEFSDDGGRENPLFKPSWSPELLHTFNYFGRLTLLSRNLALSVGGFLPGDGAGSEWGLNMRAADAAVAEQLRIRRLPHVLCHRSIGSKPDRPLPNTPEASEQRKVLRAYWAKLGIQAIVETQRDGTQRSRLDLTYTPLVSIIVADISGQERLYRCLKSIVHHTSYRNFEVIVCNNGLDPPDIELPGSLKNPVAIRFLSLERGLSRPAACNHAARSARGALLLFLGEGVEITDPNWLNELVQMVTSPGVGIAGGKVKDARGGLLHAGIGIGIHFDEFMYQHDENGEWGVFGSPDHVRNWSAVTGSCQIVRRDVFGIVGGYDELYASCHADVVLCLQAQRAGWRTAYTPFAIVVDHGGSVCNEASFPRDAMRFAREMQRLGAIEDPYLHPQLSGASGIPRLRGPGEPSLRERLRLGSLRLITEFERDEPVIDLFNGLDIQTATELPLDRIMWPAQSVEHIGDLWGAARWLLNMLWSRRDLRRQYPRALRDGVTGAFALWVAAEGSLGLPEDARVHIAAAFVADLSARPCQLYFWREDLRTAYPLGLTPAGRGSLAICLLQNGQGYGLRLEEVWWFLLSCDEDPAAEVCQTFLFTPTWQKACPDGLTIFGREHLAVWIRDYYALPDQTDWLEASRWPVQLSPPEQIRLAYAARPPWREKHPGAFADRQSVLNLLNWLSGPEAGLSDEIKAWCAARLTDGTAERLVSPGVNIIGHFCYPSGLRVTAEAMADAIEQADGNVSRRDLRTSAGDDPHHAEFGGLEVYDITILHMQPEPLFDVAYARSDLAERSPRTYRIACWYWELETVPASWAETARSVDEIWVATTFVAQALQTISPVPLKTLCPGVKIGNFIPRPREAFGLATESEKRFMFYFSFHMASTIERKNPLGLIQAFRRAFTPDQNVDLVVKTTSTSLHADQVAELLAATEGANITVIDRVFTPDETLSLLNCCDAYVSLHRSEGLGLTMAEAMLLGKPVIATQYSGNLDFMSDTNSLLVDFKLVPIGKSIPPYDAAAFWAEPSIDHAAELMRRLYDDPEAARRLGARGQADAQQRLSLTNAGTQIAARLAEIQAALLGKNQT